MPRGENLIGKPGPGRPKGLPNKATQEMQAFARKVTLNDPKWVASAIERMEAGKAPHIETYLLQMGYGKPKETVELTGADGGPVQTVDMSKLSVKELEALEKMAQKVDSGEPGEPTEQG